MENYELKDEPIDAELAIRNETAIQKECHALSQLSNLIEEKGFKVQHIGRTALLVEYGWREIWEGVKYAKFMDYFGDHSPWTSGKIYPVKKVGFSERTKCFSLYTGLDDKGSTENGCHVDHWHPVSEKAYLEQENASKN